MQRELLSAVSGRDTRAQDGDLVQIWRGLNLGRESILQGVRGKGDRLRVEKCCSLHHGGKIS